MEEVWIAELIEYYSTENGGWAHGTSIFKYGGCWLGPLQSNIHLQSMSSRPIGVKYSTTEDVGWAHGTLIFNSGACPMGP